MELLDLGRSGVDPVGPSRDDLPRPCTGAFCSGMPATPFSTLPQAAPIGADHWAITIAPVRPTEPGAIVRVEREADLRAVDIADPVFHPPRPQAPAVSL